MSHAERHDELPETPATEPANESAPAKHRETQAPADPLEPANVATGRAEALAIAELCQLAGQPQRIAGFLAEGATPDQARRALLASRAESPEIASRLHPDAPAQEASPEHGPLMRAVRRMIGT